MTSTINGSTGVHFMVGKAETLTSRGRGRAGSREDLFTTFTTGYVSSTRTLIRMNHTTLYGCLTALLLCTISATAQPGCLSFDGLDDHILIDGNAFSAVGAGDFTLEAQVRGVAAAQDYHGRLLSSTGGGAGFLFFFHAPWGGSAMRMLAVQLGGINYLLLDNGALAAEVLDDLCHHVAIARENDSLHFFVDGAHIGDRGIFGPDPTVASSNPILSIGSDESGGDPFEGHISQIRIFNFARTAAEILADKDYNLAPGTPGLIGYWKLSEAGGQTVIDAAGGADGVLGTTTAPEDSDPSWGSDCCDMSGTIGIADQGANNNATLVLDPSGDRLWIERQSVANATVEVRDAIGRLVIPVRPITGLLTGVDLSSLATGSYSAVVRDGKVAVLRFVKLR